jgi:DNA-binding response OmpR family regulator
MNILVLAANSDVRFVITSVLRRTGHTVLETINERQATEAANRFEAPIHILVIDLDPKAAEAFASSMRLAQERTETGVLFISAHPKEHFGFELAEVALARTAFLEKPFMPKDLFSAIATLTGPT